MLVATLPVLSACGSDSKAATSSATAEAGPCEATAATALEACVVQADADRLFTIAACENFADDAERAECIADAEAELIEAEEECTDQGEARLALCEVLGSESYEPELDPTMFVDPADIGGSVAPNTYFPLVPGNTWVYEGDGETVTVTVTEDTKEILGITSVVVRDTVEEEGELVEDTMDWYAQDINGNVWYMGEISQNFEDGELVDLEGSWTAGLDLAHPGIQMKAAPAVGDVYRQEFLLDAAEDIAEVVDLNGTETVPAASCSSDCLVTLETTPLEPDVEENKYYAPDIGMILEVDLEEGTRVELVSFTGG